MRFSLLLVFYCLLAPSACNFTDNSIKGNLNTDTLPLPNPVLPPVELQLKKNSVPFGIKIAFDAASRAVTISQIQRGVSFKVIFDEDQSEMSDLSCNSLTAGVAVLPNGLNIQLELKNTAADILINCQTSHGPIAFVLKSGAQDIGIISTTSATARFTNPSIGGPANKWMLFGAQGLSLNGFYQIYAKNLESNETILISSLDGSVEGNSDSHDALFSPDGTKVVFTSIAKNFPSPTTKQQIYVKSFIDLSIPPILVSTTNGTEPGDGFIDNPHFSPDSTNIIFESSSSNFPGANGSSQLYMKDLNDLTALPILISTTNGVTPGNSGSYFPIFSPNGAIVVFSTNATNFPNSNGQQQIYMKDLGSLTDPPTLISSSNGVTAADSYCIEASISHDSSKVLFSTRASNFPSANVKNQIYLKDLTNLTASPILISSTNGTVAGDEASSSSLFSQDDSKVIFLSDATNFPSANGEDQIYLKDLSNLSASPILISGTDSVTPGLSRSVAAQFIAGDTEILFTSGSTNFASGDSNNHIYTKLLNQLDSPPELISSPKKMIIAGTGASFNPDYSPDGSVVAFTSTAKNFPGGIGPYQIYIKKQGLLDDTPILVSSTDGVTPGLGHSVASQFSPDGTKIIFSTNSANFPLSNGNKQIYLKDLNQLNDSPILISGFDETTAGTGDSQAAVFSNDGTKILFSSSATNFQYQNGFTQIYIKDIVDLSNEPILVSSTNGTLPGDAGSTSILVHPSGSLVYYSSSATNFPSSNGSNQIYSKDLDDLTSLPILISSTDGATAGSGDSYLDDISPDGNTLLIASRALNFPLANGQWQIYTKDLGNLTIIPTLITTADGSSSAASACYGGRFSPDGLQVAFNTAAADFPDANSWEQIWMKDRSDLTALPTLLSSIDGTVPAVNGDSSNSIFAPDGKSIIFDSTARNLTSYANSTQLFKKILP